MKIKPERYLALVALWGLFALLTLGAGWISLTADELTYVALGYGLLARGREVFPLLIQRAYTPLLVTLEAMPLYLTNPHIPVDKLQGWPNYFPQFIHDFAPYFNAFPQMKLLVRMPIILLVMILGAVVFRWGKALWGAKAGLLALGVMLFDPSLLAFGRLANSDAGTVAFGTAALYATWRWMKRPAWRWALAASVLLGLTMLSKVSGLLWAMAASLMVLATIATRRGSRHRRERVELLGQGVIAGGLSLVLLWAGYGFEVGKVPGLPFTVPVPTHWENLLYLNKPVPTYFALGFRQSSGWWWYFPLAFLIKNPLPLLIGFGLSLIVLGRRPFSWLTGLTLTLFPLLYTLIAMAEKLDIGYRLMLPIHPFLYLLIGGGLGGWAWQPAQGSRRRWAVGALGLWYAVTTLSIFPYEISYFNELVGGPDGGYKYLSDSNVDWGQATDVLQAYIHDHPDVHAQPPLSKFAPAPGRYIVGASTLQGIVGDPQAYEWFRHQEPQAIIAHSLLVYEAPAAGLNWIAQCDEPATPLTPAAVAEGTGQANLRQLSFSCRHAWLYPGGGASQGLYALDRAVVGKPKLCFPAFLACLPAPADAFITRHLTPARLAYAHPDFVLFESTASAPVPAPLPAYPVWATQLPYTPATSQPLRSPMLLNGPLEFLGVEVYGSSGAFEVETWWRVVSRVDQRPFSIMAHLVTSDGTTLGVMDGLGVPLASLAAGDIIVQRHQSPALPAQTDVWLLTGAYWLDTSPPELWAVNAGPEANAILIHLNPAR